MSNRSGLTLMRRAAGAGAMLLACAPVLADVTIGNWEDSADGWIDWGTQAPIDGNPKYAYSTTGATLGNKSLQISQAGWGQNLAIKLQQDYSPALDLRDEFMANSQFSLDFTVPAIATPGWS